MAIVLLSALACGSAEAAEAVFVDLDIGDDIDDAFALALTVTSPEFDVLGIGTVVGDTPLRVRLVHRLLQTVGRDDIAVAPGPVTTSPTVFSQARWARGGPDDGRAAATSIDLLLRTIAARPGSVTLLAFGPLTNVAAALRRDPRTFRLLKRIVMMGGSVRTGYGRSQYGPPSPPAREYNVGTDVEAARLVLGSGVPIELFPLDSTLVQFDDVRRNELFAHGSALSDALASLYHQWSAADQPWASAIPTLFDVVPVAALIDATLCPLQPLAVAVRDDGLTIEASGPANVRVCLKSDRQRVLDLMMRRLLSDRVEPR